MGGENLDERDDRQNTDRWNDKDDNIKKWPTYIYAIETSWWLFKVRSTLICLDLSSKVCSSSFSLTPTVFLI